MSQALSEEGAWVALRLWQGHVQQNHFHCSSFLVAH
jgi:hypothetical protein